MSELRCDICFHHCLLQEGEVGFCRVRANKYGTNTLCNYGIITSMALDPIEKKPLFQFHPHSKILSLGSFGCNLNCPFCQNSALSWPSINSLEYDYYSPEDIVKAAKKLIRYGNIGVAFTYNEPVISWEYIKDVAKLIHKAEMFNVVVTNGTLSLKVLEEFLPYIDAFNIDLKGFSKESYKRLSGDFNSVKKFIKRCYKSSHIEITTLISPHVENWEKEVLEESLFLASIDKTIPLHLTRFFPSRNMMEESPTSLELLKDLQSIAKENLDNVYLGNV
ncbi:MAG: radical SAM protein [Spirochaetales bacterium]|nr:radical SAM protein [Spirochaetales bacterium]